MRRAAKRDISEPEIVNALTQCGFSVVRMDQPADLLCGFRGKTYLVECKTDTKRGGLNKRTKAQAEFLKTWRGQYQVLHDAQEAIDWATEIAKR